MSTNSGSNIAAPGGGTSNTVGSDVSSVSSIVDAVTGDTKDKSKVQGGNLSGESLEELELEEITYEQQLQQAQLDEAAEQSHSTGSNAISGDSGGDGITTSAI